MATSQAVKNMATSSDKQLVFYEGKYYSVTLPSIKQRKETIKGLLRVLSGACCTETGTIVSNRPVRIRKDSYEDYTHSGACCTESCRGECLDEFIKPEAPKESKQKKKHRQPGVNRNIHPSLKKGGREWH